MKKFKVKFVGDRNVGKTSLIMTFANYMNFPGEHPPQYNDEYVYNDVCRKEIFRISVWDSFGDEKGADLKHIDYEATDLFVIVYGCDDPASFDHAGSKWVEELQSYLPNVPYILMATKTALRNDQATIDSMNAKFGRGPITTEEGQKLAEKIGAIVFHESNAATLEGVQNFFKVVLVRTLSSFIPKIRKEGCTLS